MKFTYLVIAGALLLVGCAKKQEDATKAAAVEEPVRPVRSIVVGRADLGEALHLPGEVRARHEQR